MSTFNAPAFTVPRENRHSYVRGIIKQKETIALGALQRSTPLSKAMLDEILNDLLNQKKIVKMPGFPICYKYLTD